MHIWRARLAEGESAAAPGVVSLSGRRLLVGCGDRAYLEPLEVQLEGRKKMAIADFVNGQRPEEGEALGGEIG